MSPFIRFAGRTRIASIGLAIAAAVTVGASPGARATTLVHWQRKPLAISLPVGAERILVFGDPVRVGLPSMWAKSGALRVQSTNGAVYLKARQAFDTQRVQIQDLKTGRIILLDLDAKKHASSETVRVIDDAANLPASQASDAAGDAPHDAASKIPPAAFGESAEGAPSPIRLVRHAAQALYAPARLVGATPGIHRVALDAPAALPGLLPTYPVRVRPLAAWRAGAYRVTAIEIVNRSARRTFTLDPRTLEGDFYAASFMQDTIGPAGSDTDTTTLFVVTEHGGLAQALSPPAGDMTTAARGDNAD